MLRKLRPLLVLAIFLTLLSVTSGVAFAKENEKHIRVCPKSGGKEVADCHARVIVDQAGLPKVTTFPSGYGPAQFRGAYNLSGVVSTSTTIAIVDAYDHPNIYSDLLVYRSAFGITTPLGNCPVSTGTPNSPCFQKVNQNGLASPLPKANAGWALEIALDVEITHAICQNCNILLVEAKSNSYADLMTAVDQAVAMRANVISNSYGSGEFSGETTYDSHFNVPGIAFTFSSGDSGYGTSYPAASQYVTAVGGTTLNLSSNTYLNETAWSGAGSGCSLFEFKPSWQHDSGCLNRTIADISADADPNTGAAVYDSVRYQGKQSWFKVGGTSLASPLIAGVYALGGVSSILPNNQLPYNNLSSLNDITFGSNGSCGTYLCNATSGYDGPTGLGSPNGSSTF